MSAGAPAGALTTGTLGAVIRRVALPAVASNLLVTTFMSADAYWVGTRIGPAGLAAVSTSIFWIWMVVSVAEMVAVGLTAVAARRHGEGDPEAAAKAAGDAVRYAIVLALGLTAVGLPALDRLFAVMQTPPEVTALGRRYLGTFLLGLPAFLTYFVVDAAFRASGDTRTPLLLLAASVAVTLVLDPLLILGAGPLPALGIGGAATAIVCTRGTACVIGLVLLRRRGMLRFGRVRWATIGTMSRVGAPVALTGVMFSLVYVLLTRTTGDFGTAALAALGIGHRVESWLHMVGVGFAAAAAAIVGQNLGAGQVERAARAGWLTTWYATGPALAFAACAFAAPQLLAGLFTRDPVVLAEASSYLRINVVSQALLATELVLEGALGGAGHTVPPMVTSTALTAARIPLAAWAAARWGVEGIWWVISLTAAGRGVAMMALWRWGRWRRSSV